MSLAEHLAYARDPAVLAGLSTGARHLLARLALHAPHIEPSVDELAREMGVMTRQVQKCRAELVAAGRVIVEMRGGRHRPNRYRFPIGNPVVENTVPEDTVSRKGVLNPVLNPVLNDGPRGKGKDVLTSTYGSSARPADPVDNQPTWFLEMHARIAAAKADLAQRTGT